MMRTLQAPSNTVRAKAGPATPAQARARTNAMSQPRSRGLIRGVGYFAMSALNPVILLRIVVFPGRSDCFRFTIPMPSLSVRIRPTNMLIEDANENAISIAFGVERNSAMDRSHLADLTAFVAVAKRLSFRAAASQLGVTPSALSHAMRQLEARIGVRLLHRTTRSVSLTDAGRPMVRHRPDN